MRFLMFVLWKLCKSGLTIVLLPVFLCLLPIVMLLHALIEWYGDTVHEYEAVRKAEDL